MFDNVRQQVDKFAWKKEQISYKHNRELQDQLSKLVDFGDKEQALLQDLWHSTVGLLFSTLQQKQQEGEEYLSCDGPKYWLEEAQQLSISSDDKVQKLNYLSEELDLVMASARLCKKSSQLDAVLSYASTEVAPRLCFTRLKMEFKSSGAQAKNAGKNKNTNPVDYLRTQIRKLRKKRESAVVSNEDDGDAVMADGTKKTRKYKHDDGEDY